MYADFPKWPAWSEAAEKFFTLTDIASLMRDAWYMKPTGLSGTSPQSKVTYQSWYEMWNELDWDDNWILNGPGLGAPGGVRTILRGIEVAHIAVPDPSQLSLQDWFNLFMGYDDNGSASQEPLQQASEPGAAMRNAQGSKSQLI
jgi:hypothetical protein